MRARWPVFSVLLILGAGYFGYPYVTLYRLDVAMRDSDSATLRSLVDWYAVREGLKEDICDMVVETPSGVPRNSNDLPPFGAGFVRGIAGNVLDQTVTPETIASMSHVSTATPRPGSRVIWAFFNNPTQFAIDVRAGDTVEPIHMMMELRHMRWQVRRVWLPNQMLERANSGT